MLKDQTNSAFTIINSIIDYNESIILWENTNELFNISRLLNSIPKFTHKNSSVDILNKLIIDNIGKTNFNGDNFIAKYNVMNLFDSTKVIESKVDKLDYVAKTLLKEKLPRFKAVLQ
jgi:hypothetical protein